MSNGLFVDIFGVPAQHSPGVSGASIDFYSGVHFQQWSVLCLIALGYRTRLLNQTLTVGIAAKELMYTELTSTVVDFM